MLLLNIREKIKIIICFTAKKRASQMNEKSSPKVVVVGAGGIGGLFGGLLFEGGLDVTLVDLNQEHVDAINSNGLKIIGYGGDRFVGIKATTDPNTAGVADIVIVQCKAMHTQGAVKNAMSVFDQHTTVVSFQNGIGNEEVIASVIGEGRVIGALTAQAGMLEGPGIVRNYSDLPTYVGELFGPNAGPITPRIENLAKIFSAAGLDTHASTNIRLDMWKKLLGNIGLSAASGITDLCSADMVKVPELAETIHRALNECATVAKACGILIDEAEKHQILDKLTNAVAGTGDAKSSLCADLRAGRPTEVDRIYGTVVRLGKEHGIPTPTLDTLVSIVRGLESHYM
jgi:2-dehydropantoate 2-reductase